MIENKLYAIPGYDALSQDEYGEKSVEVLYHEKLVKISQRIDWFNAWSERSEILKQDTWDDKNYEEWEKNHLTNLSKDVMLFGETFVDVMPEQGVFEETNKILTCVRCGKTIPPFERHYITGLITNFGDPYNEDMSTFCNPRHIECESEDRGLES